ncbi:MAG TPA: hypothetical protein VMF69_19130 [Gemmataceae bacterium]|nr:hypothetical protein [Gemmataceae bacterium]
MDPLVSFRATAQEIVSFARQRGIDLEPLRKDFAFQKDRRYIDCWRKDSLPGTGPAHEPLGTLHYNMQGAITVLPSQLKESASIFRGRWHETGTFENIEQAFELVKGWLVDWKEVDDLPSRAVRSYGI